MGQQPYEFSAQSIDLLREFAAELALCQFEAQFGLGPDGVQHSLSLRQIQAAVQEGSFRKLSCLCESGSSNDASLTDSLQDEPISVAVDLHHVLRGKRSRGLHIDYQAFVEYLLGQLTWREA